jgi:hypothetical protein
LPAIRAIVETIIADDKKGDCLTKEDLRFWEFMASVQTAGLKAMLTENSLRLKERRSELARCKKSFLANCPAHESVDAQPLMVELAFCRELVRTNADVDKDLGREILDLVSELEAWFPYTIELAGLKKRVAKWLERQSLHRMMDDPGAICFMDKNDPTKPPMVFLPIRSVRRRRTP